MDGSPPRVDWATTRSLIEDDLEIHEFWFPGVPKSRPLWWRCALAIVRTEMFGASFLFRLQTFLYGVGWRRSAIFLSRLNRIFFAVTIGRDVRIGGGLYIAHGHAVIEGTSTIGRRVSIGPFVTIGLVGSAFDVRGARIGDEVMVGTGAKILGRVVIGDGARVGAGAVVLDDIPAGRSAVGVPARVTGETSGT